MTDPTRWAAPGGGPPWQPFPPGWPPPPPGWPPMAPKPGVIPLRPLGVGEILDGAISYIRASPGVTLGLSAVVITLTQLIQVPVQYLYLDSLAHVTSGPAEPTLDKVAGVIGGGLTSGVIGGFVTFIAVTLLTGMLIVVLSRAVLGRRATAADAWAAVKPRLPGLLGVTFLTGLALGACFLVGFLPLVLGVLADAPGGLLALLGLVFIPAALCVALWLGVSWSMVAPAYVLEGIPAMAAFGRSMRLVRGQWWRVFGILLLGVVISGAISVAVALPFSLAGGLLAGLSGAGAGTGSTALVLVVSSIGAIVASTITSPFSAGVTGLLYFDQRIRREALDLELARAAAQPPPPW
jgi:hypothetical protein